MTKASGSVLWWCVFAVIVGVAACRHATEEVIPDDNIDTGSDTEKGTAGGTGDTDADTDSDTDADGDSDSDTDGDTDTLPDTDDQLPCIFSCRSISTCVGNVHPEMYCPNGLVCCEDGYNNMWRCMICVPPGALEPTPRRRHNVIYYADDK